MGGATQVRTSGGSGQQRGNRSGPGGSGLLMEASQSIDSILLRPTVVVWIALLAAPRHERNSNLENQLLLKWILEMKPPGSDTGLAGWLLVSNIYAAAGRRRCVEKVHRKIVI